MVSYEPYCQTVNGQKGGIGNNACKTKTSQRGWLRATGQPLLKLGADWLTKTQDSSGAVRGYTCRLHLQVPLS